MCMVKAVLQVRTLLLYAKLIKIVYYEVQRKTIVDPVFTTAAISKIKLLKAQQEPKLISKNEIPWHTKRLVAQRQ